MNLLYYSELELCGGVVIVSFFKVPPLTSNALLIMLHPPLKNVLQTVDHFASELPFHGWKSPEKKWISGTPLEHPPYSPDLVPYNFWAFPTMKRELRGKKF
jgi:hypothetical protein